MSPLGQFHVKEKEEGIGRKSLLFPWPGGVPQGPLPWNGPRDVQTAPLLQGMAPAWPRQ